MNILYILLVTFLLNFHDSQPAKEPDMSWIQGEWAGTGFQTDTPEVSTWTISFYADLKNNAYSISYPSLNCSGEWKLITGDAQKALFKETITDGLEYCMDGGKIIITKVDENHISYSYFFPETELQAFSTLTKKEIKK